MLLEEVPGGARWRYVWGSCLAFVFSIQLVTGVLLMTAYSPSSTQAWSSVHYIQYQMDFGWLIRGLHHFGSQTMMVLIALHMLQVVIAGAHLRLLRGNIPGADPTFLPRNLGLPGAELIAFFRKLFS